jgi:DNA polymerase I-like protein with 3'-5' exonuclease and polymerase domains
MNIICCDFETYYDRQFSLTKMTTEEYIRNDMFEVIGVAVAVDDGAPEWFSGTQAETKAFLKKFDWENALALAHNTQFDGAILNWHFGIKPKGYLDTLCMARAIHGVDAGGSLKALAERYNIGEKGTEVLDALGKRRVGFTPEELDAYGRYCCNDVELTRTLFHRFMLPGLGNSFPTKELKVIDTTLKMFIQPTLVLQQDLLIQHLENVKNLKAKLLESAQANIDDLMSSDRFAELLKALGVVPPTKVSARTGKEAWAFAKTDEEFKALLEHTDPRVQALVSARLGNKTTLEETRTQRFIDISSRGLLPVPIKYYAAHTGRWGGDDKINLQNLPSRGNNAGKLKKSIRAPDGYMMIDCDSSQIEARTVAWLAGQDDLVDAFDKGEDVYKIMASAIYGKDVEEISKDERFVGKTTILGAGYGMGAQKFQVQLKTFGVEIEADEANRIIQVYRKTYDKIPELWKQAQKCVEGIVDKKVAPFGAVDAVKFDPIEGGFLLPSGLWQRYDGLERVYDAEGKVQYQYKTRKGAVKIYGGKVVENLCQAIARCVIAEQMLLIGKKYRVVLTVHDAVACLAPTEEVLEAQKPRANAQGLKTRRSKPNRQWESWVDVQTFTLQEETD